MKTLPDFSFEEKMTKKGYKFIAGIDEVGRGSFAGPVIASCVILSSASIDVYIDDSKRMTKRGREKASNWIKANSTAFGIGIASVAQINKLGIKKATEIAFRKAIKEVNKKWNIDYLLIDAFYIPNVKGVNKKKQLAIVKGDRKSLSIAAASILAKVYRDSLMISLSKDVLFKHYKWHKNKGYGTAEHRNAIKKHGITKHHRKLFVEKTLKGLEKS